MGLAGRLLRTDGGDPHANVALEEAILREGTAPTLRLWGSPESVVIGRGQLASAETDLDYCRSHGIPVVRRVSAGGAVYHGRGNLNWSFFMPRGEVPGGAERDAKAVFSSFAASVVSALGACGVEARFEPPNRLLARGGKVSGMAAYISREVVLCHGTLLIDADLELAARVTTPAKDELPRRYPRSSPARMANCGADVERFAESLAGSWGGFREGRLDEAEARALAGLLPKYGSDAWNLGDPFA